MITESSFLLKSYDCFSLCGLCLALFLQSTAGVCYAVLCYLAQVAFDACFLTDYSLQLLFSEIIDSLMGFLTLALVPFFSFSAFSDLCEFNSWLEDLVLPECIWFKFMLSFACCVSSVYRIEVKEEKLWKSL